MAVRCAGRLGLKRWRESRVRSRAGPSGFDARRRIANGQAGRAPAGLVEECIVDKSQRLDALRLSEADELHVLQELEEAAAHPVSSDLRASHRYRYHVREGLLLQVPGFPVQFIVRPRNLSTGGVSVLHGSFLYPGTTCTIMLKTIDGEQLCIDGRIIRCRCVHGRAHEVNIRFDKQIEIENFIDMRQARLVDGAESSAASVYPSSQVARLARRLEELATEGAPQEQLARVVTQLVALLGAS